MMKWSKGGPVSFCNKIMSPVTLLTLSVVAMTAVSVSSAFAADKPQTGEKN
jgi:hypothetical protein